MNATDYALAWSLYLLACAVLLFAVWGLSSRFWSWIKDPLRKRIREFEWVLNARYPTTTDLGITPFRRRVLRSAAAIRYRTGIYRDPIELRALQRLLPYRRPETSGF